MAPPGNRRLSPQLRGERARLDSRAARGRFRPLAARPARAPHRPNTRHSPFAPRPTTTNASAQHKTLPHSQPHFPTRALACICTAATAQPRPHRALTPDSPHCPPLAPAQRLLPQHLHMHSTQRCHTLHRTSRYARWLPLAPSSPPTHSRAPPSASGLPGSLGCKHQPGPECSETHKPNSIRFASGLVFD